MPNRKPNRKPIGNPRTLDQRGASLLAVLIAAAVFLIVGGMAVALVNVNFKTARAVHIRNELNNIAEAVARKLAAARITARRNGFVVVSDSGIALDSRTAGTTYFYHAEVTKQLDATRVHVSVRPSVRAPGLYAEASATY